MNTPSAWDSLLLAKVSKITPSSYANSCEFWIEGMCIRQCLPYIKWIWLSCFLVSFTGRLAYLVMQMKLIQCLQLFRKSVKTHVAGLNFWLVFIKLMGKKLLTFLCSFLLRNSLLYNYYFNFICCIWVVKFDYKYGRSWCVNRESPVQFENRLKPRVYIRRIRRSTMY